MSEWIVRLIRNRESHSSGHKPFRLLPNGAALLARKEAPDFTVIVGVAPTKDQGCAHSRRAGPSLQAFDLIATESSATLRRVEGGNPEFQEHVPFPC